MLLIKNTASIGLLLTLTACAGLPTKSKQEVKSIPVPVSANDPLNVRAQADYQFIVGEMYSREGKSTRAIKEFEKVATLDTNSSTVHMRLAAEYLKVDKLSEAIRHAEIGVQKDPNSIDPHLVLARLYTADKTHDKAIAEYNAVLRINPKNSEAPILIGALYSDKRDYKKAEQQYLSLLKQPGLERPEEVHYYIGLMHLDQKGSDNQAAAEKAIKKALQIKPNYEEAVLTLANLYSLQNERSKAFAVCHQFQKQNGFHAKVAELLAQMYIEDKNNKKAYEQFDLIVANSYPSQQMLMKMALILVEQKQYNEAIARLNDIINQYPKADTARYYLAAVHEETGDAKNAIRNYMLVPASSEHFSESVVHAAYLLKGMGKINQALNVTEKGLKANADKPQVYTMHASLLDAKADYLGAARVLEQGLTKYSKNVEMIFRHALVLDRLGKKDDMIAQMKKVLELEPDHVQSMNYLAFSLAELNRNLPEAEKLARRALELNPKDGYVLDTLGWVLFKQGKVADSIKVLEQAHQYQASAAIIAEHLADAYATGSQTDKANAMYAKAAGLTKDQKRANQLRSKIQKVVVNLRQSDRAL
ncbi:tetratricopeptide repeat protein [Bdellovibrio sp. HCB274]|uniref:tetratricopeptide repeat protein n=1 Tax=Bdellovibrio sp. HCB274 TaxID=3394361 RepID=UPI0039B5BF30